jgi:hypothetical protein
MEGGGYFEVFKSLSLLLIGVVLTAATAAALLLVLFFVAILAPFRKLPQPGEGSARELMAIYVTEESYS